MKPCMHTLIRALTLCLIAGSGQQAYAGQPLVCLIQPSSIAEVGTSVTGVIETFRVERGDYVKKGQVIAVLRNDVERAALSVASSRAQAEADVQAAMVALQFAHQNTVRADDLFRKKFISEQALDKTRTEEQVAAQKLAQAREQRQIWVHERNLAQSQLAQRTITSPISGIVAERYLSIGEHVEDRSVARVVSINPLHVEVMVPAADFGKIKAGMSATVTPELPDAAPVEARVKLVDKLIDGASNTFRVRLELPNPDNALPAGPRCKLAFGDPSIDAVGGALKPKPALSIVRAPKPVASAPGDAATAPGIEKGVLLALERWRKAWENKDLAGYLAAYTPDFKGEHASRKAWLERREALILKPGNLDIRISDARIQPGSGSQTTVRFRQTYRARNYRDDTLKSLRMVLEQGQWLIQEERALP